MHLELGYLFVHAGMEPGLELRQLGSEKLLNIRGRCFRKPHRLPCTVIHGPTPSEACVTGILTVVAVDCATGNTRLLKATAPRKARDSSVAAPTHSDAVPIGATE
jgi:hypothetical protein